MSVEINVIILAQILAFILSTYIILTERKYCKNYEWWSDIAMVVVIIMNLAPIVGLFTSFGISIDCIRNIAKELEKYKRRINYESKNY